MLPRKNLNLVSGDAQLKNSETLKGPVCECVWISRHLFADARVPSFHHAFRNDLRPAGVKRVSGDLSLCATQNMYSSAIS